MGCFLLFSSCLTEYYQVQLSGLHEYWTLTIYLVMYPKSIFGAIAQLARAPALQAGGPGFESPSLHHHGGAVPQAQRLHHSTHFVRSW